MIYKIVKPIFVHFTRGQEMNDPDLLFGISIEASSGCIIKTNSRLFFNEEPIDNDNIALSHWEKNGSIVKI